MGCCSSTETRGGGAVSFEDRKEIDLHVKLTIESHPTFLKALPMVAREVRERHTSVGSESQNALVQGNQVPFSSFEAAAHYELTSCHDTMEKVTVNLLKQALFEVDCHEHKFQLYQSWCRHAGGNEEAVKQAIAMKVSLELHNRIYNALTKTERRSSVKATPAAATPRQVEAHPPTPQGTESTLTTPPSPAEEGPAGRRNSNVTADWSAPDRDQTPQPQETVAIVTPPAEQEPEQQQSAAVDDAASSPPIRTSDVEPVLPPGDWVKCEENADFYYSVEEDLFYHPKSGWSYDKRADAWYDPDADQWIEDLSPSRQPSRI